MKNSTIFITAGMCLAWMVSPEVLVAVGRFAGTGVGFAPLALIAALFLSCAGGWLIDKSAKAERQDKTDFIRTSAELAAQGSTVIFIPTGMVVTAGFTFNETLVYWFPNFGFSAILLLLIFTLHMIGENVVNRAQLAFTGSAFALLLTIALCGLFITNEPGDVSSQASAGFSLGNVLSLFCGSLLLFLSISCVKAEKLSTVSYFLIFAIGAILLALWQFAAMRYVPTEKLTTSTISYILIARESLGQPGRILIALAVISGSCAALNFFMTRAKERYTSFTTLCLQLPASKTPLVVRVFVFLFSAVIGGCLATGLAGEDRLELYIYGSLLLWLLSFSLQIADAARQLKQSSPVAGVSGQILGALFIASFLYLTLNHESTSKLITFLALALSVSCAIVASGFLLARNYNKTTSLQGDKT